ncbi:MAG: hypothetical protein KAQ93_00845 [Spirochaetales bacterium]|nr:hypothetical protein [Spirochaetales bacterium]
MKDWKIIIISAALAFLFSFISGLFGRVSFGVLLFRALSGAFVFGAIGFGIAFLFRRYLPELFELKSGSDSKIDEDFSQIQQKADVSADLENSQADKPVIDISIGDESEEPESELSSENKNIQANNSNNSGNELVDEIVESGDTAETGENDQVPGNIDVLPDMGVFSNSFENEEDVNGNDSSSAGAVTLDIMGEEQDPELVARAVRTMVKKDQEG